MRKLLVQLASLAAFSSPAVAADVLETASFAMTLPAGWVKNLQTKPVSARGPDGELLQLSSAKLQGGGTPAEAQKIRAEMEQNVLRSIERAASDPELKVVVPLRRTQGSPGVAVYELISQANDNSWFAQFAALGPSTVLLVTVEAPATAQTSIVAVRQSVLSIKWSQ
ncbi:hypothetical protein SAMN05216350_101294 [Polaromonas sp. YR568]|uniref:hypothetical protein n=1 Tax=Polaromonas sp. YR568 TaxID=1855301 RepID=UPI0008E50FC7|nr:hypothetical protein [Polaromonas sp. YR568]SFU31910.1 hypothetical protein SAMN05216350_101294 [Polaromonas sp. YR568]